jgi:hypothetical protein
LKSGLVASAADPKTFFMAEFLFCIPDSRNAFVPIPDTVLFLCF